MLMSLKPGDGVLEFRLMWPLQEVQDMRDTDPEVSDFILPRYDTALFSTHAFEAKDGHV